jgi:hypothetical protein
MVTFTFLPIADVEHRVAAAHRAQFLTIGQLVKWELTDASGAYSGLMIIGEQPIPGGFQTMANMTIKAHGNRLEAVNATTERKRARGGEISRESIAAHALDTFGPPEKARHWMNRPNPLFQGKTPAQVIEFDLVGVEAELVRIDHGVYM